MNKKNILYILGGLAAAGVAGVAIFFPSGELYKGELEFHQVFCDAQPNPALPGQTVTVTATDAGFNADSFEWSSDKDGNIGSGTSITRSYQDAGTVTYTVKAMKNNVVDVSGYCSVTVSSLDIRQGVWQVVKPELYTPSLNYKPPEFFTPDYDGSALKPAKGVLSCDISSNTLVLDGVQKLTSNCKLTERAVVQSAILRGLVSKDQVNGSVLIKLLIFADFVLPPSFTVEWDGKNDKGTPADPGIYTFVIIANSDPNYEKDYVLETLTVVEPKVDEGLMQTAAEG